MASSLRKYRIPLRAFFLAGACAVVWSIPLPSFGAEIKGKVSAISGDIVTIQIPPGQVPKVGDKVDIGFNMPGGNTISIGIWRVVAAGPNEVKAAVKEAFGDPDVGMTAKITTSGSSPRAAPPAAASASPPAPSDPRSSRGEKRAEPAKEFASKPRREKSEERDSLASAQREIERERQRIQEEQRRLREERERLEAERRRIEADRRRIEAERNRLSSSRGKPRKNREPPVSGALSGKRTPSRQPKVQARLNLPKVVKGKDGAPMVFVPAGEFMRGDTFKEGEEDERPARKIYLDGFYIDKFPVTNGLYKKMMGDKEIQGSDDSPVKDVAWEDARKFCQKAGKRLPTEAEWEKAARGTDSRRYPWGNAWDDSKVVWLPNSLGTQPVNRTFKTHESPYGAVDMAGNISEWVSDWYQGDYYRFAPKRNPKGPSRGDILQRRVIRGGSYLSGDPKTLRTSARGWAVPLAPKIHVGFRCAKDAG